MEEKQEKIYRLINMADVEVKEVEWLWYPYIPYGKITIVQGDPGEGKTTFILHLSALLSKGEPLPCESETREPVNIVYQNAEDSLEDTIKPRLLEAKADCSRILVIDESKKGLSMTDERLVKAIEDTEAKIVILDPIQAYLGADVDMHRANEIRPVLKRLGDIADKHGCAIILIGHMNKASGSKSTYRGLGSIDFQATARSVLVVGRIKDNPTLRIIAHDKSSLAPEGRSMAFEMNRENGFRWLGHYDISVDELLSGYHQESKLKKAEMLLEEMLSDGGVAQAEVVERAKKMDISKRILDTAKKNLSVQSRKNGDKWYWYLE